jgi:glycyl-tRNA synthetase beta subunit
LQDKVDATLVIPEVLNYIKERLPGYYAELGIKQDTVDAVLAVSGNILTDIDQRIKAVSAFRTFPESASLTAAYKRTRNLLRQANFVGTSYEIDSAWLHEPQEIELYRQIIAINNQVQTLSANGDYIAALRLLANLHAPVDAFFDKVMVMAEEHNLRNNRLNLLASLASLFNNIADFSLLF